MKIKDFIEEIFYWVFILIPNIPTNIIALIYLFYDVFSNNSIQEIILNREDVLEKSLERNEKVFTEVLFSSIALIFWLSIITIYVF